MTNSEKETVLQKKRFIFSAKCKSKYKRVNVLVKLPLNMLAVKISTNGLAFVNYVN